MIVNGGKNEKVAGCASIETQRATFKHMNATTIATKSATQPLKALANKVLDRNTQRNQDATTPIRRRNFYPQKSIEKLRPKSHDFLIEDLVKICANLALEPEQLWRFLSLDNINDLRCGLIDQTTLRAYAERWNDHPHIVLVGNNLPFPKSPEQKIVACKDCQHFTRDMIGDGSGIGSCAKGLTGEHQKPLYPRTKRICDSYEVLTK